MKTVAKRSLINTSKIAESGVFGPEDVNTTIIPMIPKAIDE